MVMFALKSDHICLVETWIDPRETNTIEFEVGGRDFDHASIGKGKGVAIFSKISEDPDSTTNVIEKILDIKYQILVLIDGPIQFILVYLSKNCPMLKVAESLQNVLRPDLITILAGDFNFDTSEENELTRFFKMKHYSQLLAEPTHDKG